MVLKCSQEADTVKFWCRSQEVWVKSRMKCLPKLYYNKRSNISSKLKLLQLIRRQSEVTDIHFGSIYEDNWSLPNDSDLKSKFEIFNIGVNLIYTFVKNPKMNFNYIFNYIASRRSESIFKMLSEWTILRLNLYSASMRVYLLFENRQFCNLKWGYSAKNADHWVL